MSENTTAYNHLVIATGHLKRGYYSYVTLNPHEQSPI